MPTTPQYETFFMDPFYITLLLSSPLLATLLPPLLLLIVPTKRMCFCVGKVLDKRVIALLSRNGQKMFPAQIVLLFQTSDFYTLSDRKDPLFLPAASGNTGCGVFKGGIQNQKDIWVKIDRSQMKLLNFENRSNDKVTKIEHDFRK